MMSVKDIASQAVSFSRHSMTDKTQFWGFRSPQVVQRN